MTGLMRPATGVVVTGGASGIGRASARALAEVGRPVALWDVDAARAAAVAKDIAIEFGVATCAAGLDVRESEHFPEHIADAREALGPIGGLVHSAGVSARHSSSVEPAAVKSASNAMASSGAEDPIAINDAPATVDGRLRRFEI